MSIIDSGDILIFCDKLSNILNLFISNIFILRINDINFKYILLKFCSKYKLFNLLIINDFYILIVNINFCMRIYKICSVKIK